VRQPSQQSKSLTRLPTTNKDSELSQSVHSSIISGASTPTTNAARLARNKRIIFKDKVEMYKNAEEGTTTGAGVVQAPSHG